MLAVSQAAAQTDCTTITDDLERLRCYDTKTAPAAHTAAPVPQQTPEFRAGYAEQLRKFFLGNGISANVFGIETYNPKTAGHKSAHFPKLVLLGPFGDSFVYQVLTSAKLLKNAQSVGFKSIEFSSNIGRGRYIYDLTGPKLPSCDISGRVCL